MSLSMVVGKNKYFIGKVFNNKWIKVDINIWKFSNVFPSIDNFKFISLTSLSASTKLTLILKFIGRCDFKHIMILSIKQ